MSEKISIMIACGQGVWDQGEFFSEYPADNPIYIEHTGKIKEMAYNLRCNYVVLSGGYTQSARPEISEAKSMLNLINLEKDVDSNLYILDETSLDSAENLWVGLLTCRKTLDDSGHKSIGISQINVFAAWQIKEKRFSMTAKAIH